MTLASPNKTTVLLTLQIGNSAYMFRELDATNFARGIPIVMIIFSFAFIGLFGKLAANVSGFILFIFALWLALQNAVQMRRRGRDYLALSQLILDS